MNLCGNYLEHTFKLLKRIELVIYTASHVNVIRKKCWLQNYQLYFFSECISCKTDICDSNSITLKENITENVIDISTKTLSEKRVPEYTKVQNYQFTLITPQKSNWGME